MRLGDFRLQSGEVIRDAFIAYRTFGRLNEARSNAVLVTPWFQGTSWQMAWQIGPGKLVDSSKYFVVIVDPLGNGVSSSPSPSPTNLHLAAGRASPQELIAAIKDGFYITDLIGMGANLVTGDYSRGASGLWIENGELTFPVSEVTIAGHLNDMFGSLEPANDLVFRYGTNAPTVRVEGLTVAGT